MRGVTLVAAAIAADQSAKAWIDAAFAFGGQVPYGPLGLVRLENEGASFGLFSGQPWVVLAAVPLLAALCAAALLSEALSPKARLGVQLLLAGSLSNWLDHALMGKVTDFLPVLGAVVNLADVFNVLGAGLVLLGYVTRATDSPMRADAGRLTPA